MKMRRMLVVLLLTLLGTMATVASAQDMGCFGLSADDCAVINEANAAAAASTSFNQDFTIDFSVTGVPDGDVTFNLVGSGPMAQGTGQVPLNFDLTMDVTFSSPDGDGAAKVNVKLVDDVLYLQLPDMSEDWYMVNLAEAMADPSAMGLPFNPADIASGAAMPEMDAATMGQLMGLISAPGFLDYSRDGNTFTFVADFAALFSSAEWQTASTSLTEALSANPDTAQAAGFLALLPMVFTNGTVTVTQVVDEAAGATTGLTFAFEGTINPAMMGQQDASEIGISLVFPSKSATSMVRLNSLLLKMPNHLKK
jgi:hypothetical protein